MKHTLLLNTVLAATLVTATANAAVDTETNASGTINCSYSVNVVGPMMQFSGKAHVVTTIKHADGDNYDVDVATTFMGYTDHESFQVPIKRLNDVWDVELREGFVDGDVIKLQYDNHNGVQAQISIEGSPFINMLNGQLQKDNTTMQFDGRCDFKPAH